jgi:F-type H+-transporting ATPase subunit a
METVPRIVLVRLPPIPGTGIDLSITNEVVLLWASAIVTCVFLLLAFRRRSLVPRGPVQNFFEAAAEFIDRNVVREAIGPGGERWGPFLLSLFFFILFTDLFGMLPVPRHVKAMTSNLNVTASLAAIVFVLTIAIRLGRHGLTGFLKQFVPPGVPRWIAVAIVPIEIVSWMARPLSLAVRLFANMFVGHTLILTFTGLTVGVGWLLKPLPLAGAVAMSLFEVFICFVQAFVFTLLAGLYIKDALEAHA